MAFGPLHFVTIFVLAPQPIMVDRTLTYKKEKATLLEEDRKKEEEKSPKTKRGKERAIGKGSVNTTIHPLL